MKNELLKGKAAKKMLKFLVENYQTINIYQDTRFMVAGYFKKKRTYICFDNTGGDCFVEEANSSSLAKKYCLGKISLEAFYKKQS